MAIEASDGTYSLAGTLDGHIPGTLVEDDSCSFSSGTEGEASYLCPGSYLYTFKLRGKNGYEHSVTRRLYYVPSLPLPLILTEDDVRREGYFVNRWIGGLELKSLHDDAVSVELVNPRALKREPFGWETPEPFSSTRWLQVEPINDPGAQAQLQLAHERKLAWAAAQAAAWEQGPFEEDEVWDDGDGTWGWSPPAPGPGDTPTSSSYSPQPSPEPE